MLEFNEFEWTDAEVEAAALAYVERHAAVNGLSEPLPPWDSLLTPAFAWSAARLRWAEQHGRSQDLVDAMVRNRLRRQRRGISTEET